MIQNSEIILYFFAEAVNIFISKKAENNFRGVFLLATEILIQKNDTTQCVAFFVSRLMKTFCHNLFR